MSDNTMRGDILFICLALPVQLNAASYLWDCDGVVSNAYLSTSPEYRVVRKAKHIMAVQCPMLHEIRGKPCDVRIDGMLYTDVYYDDYTIIKGLGVSTGEFVKDTGFFRYQVTLGDFPNLSETQLWFTAHCTER